MTIHAIYENGVFRPVEAVDLPEHCKVEVEVRTVTAQDQPVAMSDGLRKIYEILGRRHRSGQTDTAQRHNEHQP